jgi:hypothetical protein
MYLKAFPKLPRRSPLVQCFQLLPSELKSSLTIVSPHFANAPENEAAIRAMITLIDSGESIFATPETFKVE